MKSLAIIILSCLPLAALTVWSFVDLACERPAVELPGESVTAAGPIPAAPAAAAPLETLAKVDLLVAGPLPESAAGTNAAGAADLAAGWAKWINSRELAVEALRAMQSLSASPEELRRTLAQLEAVRAKYAYMSAPAAVSVLALLSERVQALESRSQQLTTKSKAETTWSEAQTAFRRRDYNDCLEKCRIVLERYAAAFTPAELEAIRNQERQARFAREAEQLSDRLKRLAEPQQVRDLAAPLLAKYTSAEGLSGAQQALLADLRERDRRAESEIRSQQWTQQGGRQLEALRSRLPSTFPQRVTALTAIVREHPAAAIRAQAASETARWLAEFLPEKRLADSTLLREATTREGEILRGFFKEVKDADGRLLGYQCYATWEEFQRPRSGTGTYTREMLKSAPQISQPQRWVERYNEVRRKALEHPQSQSGWIELGRVCRQAGQELAEYRTQRGANAGSLSFAADEQFLSQLVQETLWSSVQKLLERRDY